MKKILFCALLALSSSALAETTIKFSHVVAENTPKGQMAIKFKQLVEERSKGAIKVEVFPNSQLFNDDKVLEAMLLGDVQMAAPSLSKFDRYTKKLQVFDLPFIFKDMDAVNRFQQGETGQALLGSLSEYGLVGLGYLHQGLKVLSANSSIKTPADAKGKKFRIQSSDVLVAQFEAVGAVPLKKPFSEVFTLLQTKAVDGTENPWSNYYSQKFYEVQPYTTETYHGLLDYLVIISKDFLDKLPADQQALVRQAAKEAAEHGNDLAYKKAASDRQAVIDSKKTEVIVLTDAERGAWVEAMKPVWQKFEGDIGKDVIDAAINSNQ